MPSFFVKSAFGFGYEPESIKNTEKNGGISSITVGLMVSVLVQRLALSDIGWADSDIIPGILEPVPVSIIA